MFSASVKSLKLPSSLDSIVSYETEMLLLASWGHYSNDNSISDNLRSAEMEVISRDECTVSFAPPLITQHVICTKNSHCSGDSGSMLVDKNENNEFVAVGIASFGYENCKEGEMKPSVFMKISSYLSFIEANFDLII